MIKPGRLEDILENLDRVRIAVVGDLVADVYLYTEARRVSREAPVLVLEYREEKFLLGGAANAVNNIHALGATPVPVGITGRDEAGRQLRESLAALGLDMAHVLESDDRNTTTKRRIVASGLHTTFQQIVRIDRGVRRAIGKHEETRVVDALRSLEGRVDALVVSDYGYGLISPGVIEAVNEIAARGKTRVLVDSRYRLGAFQGVFAMIPNEPEVQEATGIAMTSLEDVRRGGRRILEETRAECVLITRGRQGMALFQAGGDENLIPIFGSDEVADVTGAGDTVMAAFAASCCAGASPLEAAVLANVAGGLVVMKNGTATVNRDEMREAIRREDPWPGS